MEGIEPWRIEAGRRQQIARVTLNTHRAKREAQPVLFPLDSRKLQERKKEKEGREGGITAVSGEVMELEILY